MRFWAGLENAKGWVGDYVRNPRLFFEYRHVDACFCIYVSERVAVGDRERDESSVLRYTGPGLVCEPAGRQGLGHGGVQGLLAEAWAIVRGPGPCKSCMVHIM